MEHLTESSSYPIQAKLSWVPDDLFSNENCSIAFLILNQPILPRAALYLKKNWTRALVRVAVDGGMDQLQKIADPDDPLLPDILTGDMDSVTEASISECAAKDIKIAQTVDQDETDFTKALKILTLILTKKQLKVNSIVVIGDYGGRMDHTLGNLHTLYEANKYVGFPVFLLGNTSLSWILQPGNHEIYVSPQMRTGHVGLFPVGEPCFGVTTTGLKWNLNNSTLHFGDLVSISNEFDGAEMVTVENDNKLLWTLSFDYY